MLAVGFINPTFEHPLLYMLEFDEAWNQLIDEYDTSARYTRFSGIFMIAYLSVAALMLSIKEKKVGYAIILLPLIWKSIMTLRLVTPTGIVILCMLVHLSSLFPLERSPGHPLTADH